MSVIVSLRAVIDEMEALSDEDTAYLNRKTGELITLSHEDLRALEDADTPEDLPEWPEELFLEAQKILESDDCLDIRVNLTRWERGRPARKERPRWPRSQA